MLWAAWWGRPAQLGRPENARTEERRTVLYNNVRAHTCSRNLV
jgi:hypothetical protein